MQRQHTYQSTIRWTGNLGQGTAGYRAYDRSHTIAVAGKAPILASSDPAFMGDHARHNPEELLLASLSSCHMLWYLHLCAEAGVVVVAYHDEATATMQETENGGGHFTAVMLHPVVTVADSSMTEQAQSLHRKAHELCFIANSVNFPVHHRATCLIATP